MSDADSTKRAGSGGGVALSIDASQRHPLHRLDCDRVAVHGEKCVEVIDLRNPAERRSIETCGSIGAIAVSDDGSIVAIAERSRESPPRVVVFSVNSNGTFSEIATLKDGAQRRYLCMDFSKDAKILATVSGQPDHQLTLWDWRRGEVMLRAKASSQDVFTVRFSRIYDKHLITSGTGHIKFWTLADTFTGMKLQGALGKFGKVELVDVNDFAEMENGYVVSGTETGDLLLWRECLIPAVIRQPEDTKCHAASINYLAVDRDRNYLWTGSTDGCIKQWDAERLSSPEIADDGDRFAVESIPLRTICLQELVGAEKGRAYAISCFIQLADGDFVVFLQSGGIVRLHFSGRGGSEHAYTISSIWDFVAGHLTGMALFEKSASIACSSTDGTITLIDVQQQRFIYRSAAFSSGVTCLEKMPTEVDEECRRCVAGFADGTIRVLKRCLDGWKLVSAMKPHKASVAFVQLTSKWAVTGCSEGRLFFYTVADCRLFPYGMTELPSSALRDSLSAACALLNAEAVIVGTSHGKLFHVEVPIQIEGKTKDSGSSYSIDCAITHIRLPESIDSGNGSERVLCIEKVDLEDGRDRLLVSFGGKESSRVCMIALEGSACKSASLLNISSTIVCLRRCLETSQWLLGTDDGRVHVGRIELTNADNSQPRWIEEIIYSLHDCETGSIMDVALLPFHNTLVSVSSNGSILRTDIPCKELEKSTRPAEYLPLIEEDSSPEAENIVGSKTYSIDEAQVKEAEKLAEKHAIQKKERIRHYIQELRGQLTQLKKQNAARSDDEQLADSAFYVDAGLEERIQRLVEQQIADAKRTFEYELEREYIGLNKLQNRFFNRKEAHVETLTGLASSIQVASYSVDVLDASLEKRLEQLKNELDRRGDQADCADDLETAKTNAFRDADVQVAAREAATGEGLGRTRSRKIREKRIEEHAKKEPKDDEDNADDVEAIQRAKETLGDLKLKTEFVDSVPKELRENPAKKELELLELERDIYRKKVDFNDRFGELRHAKQQLISEIRACDEYLHRFQAEDSRAESEPDISPEALELDQESNESRLDRKVKDLLNEAKTFLHKAVIQEALNRPLDASSAEPRFERFASEQAPPLRVQRIIDQLKKRRKNAIATFDHDLSRLLGEKLDTDCDLKYGRLMQIVKKSELACLRGYQEKEDAVESKISAKLEEKRLLQKEVVDLQTILDQKASAHNFQQLQQELQKRFDKAVPENHSHRSYLWKLFNSKADAQRQDRSSSDCESSVQDDASSDEEDDAASLGELSEEVRTAVCELRDERLKIDAQQLEATKETESTRKEKEIRSKKLKTVEMSLTALQSEMQRCQSEKQTELNAIRTLVVLRPSQIETTSSNEGELHIQDAVVLHKEQLDSLEARPQEIEKEISELKQRHQALKMDFLQLRRDKDTKANNLEHLKTRLEQIQMLKFGQTIDLDAVDAARAESKFTQQPLEPPEKVPRLLSRCLTQRLQARALEEQLHGLDSEISDIEHEIQTEIKRNTELLEDLSSRKMKSLEVEKATLKPHPDTEYLESTLLERQRSREHMIKVVREQSKTIVELKSHLDRFKRKDSWVLC